MGRVTHRWSPEEEAVVVAEYAATGPAGIAKRMGISERAVTHKASRLGVPVDRKLTAFERNKKSTRVNAVYFDAPWHPEMAYIAGYIHADANITQGAIQLDCHAQDQEIVLNVRNALKSTHKLTWSPARQDADGKHRGPSIRCAFTNSVLVKGLNRKTNLCSGKSYVDVPIPISLPPEHQCHYLRGYFEGDGWVNPKDRSAGFTGTPVFLSQVVDVLAGLGMTRKKIEWNGTSDVNKKVRWAKLADWRLLYDFLYRDAGTLFLSRKRLVFENRLSSKLSDFVPFTWPKSNVV